ncbi:MAG: translation initiation factor IF-2 [Clostridia bacterium]|nr:translation initiation factor IF-2 [Clostridia bacterium]
MGSIKIHEIAKKLGLTSKEVLKKAQELGMEVKSHLSGITDAEAGKLEKSFNSHASETPKEAKEEKKEKKEKDKTSGPVIIRRAVIISDEEVKKQEEEQERKKKAEAKKEVGFIDNRKKDFNIVYRNKQAKPLTVSELFGLKKEEPKKTQEVAEPVAQPKEDVAPKKEEEKKNYPETTPQNRPNPERKPEQKPQYNNNRFDPQNRQNFDRNNNRFNNNGNGNNFRKDQNGRFNNNNRNNFGNNRPFNDNRPFNNQQNNSNGRFNNGQGRFNNNNNNQRPNFNNNRRPLDERGIEKNIKDIMSADFVEKESVREYANRAIDKQKLNRPEESKKKTSKTRRNDDSDFSSGRLKDLKQESKLSHMFNEGSMLDYYDLSDGRNRKNKKKAQKNEEERTKQKIFQLTDITIPEVITVKDLATELKKTSGEVIKKLLGYGIMATINNEVDFDTAFLIAEEFGVTAHKKEVVKEEDILFDDSEDKEEELISRPPVIVVMGHVDHGKTSLLDAVRSTNVIEGEAGGITQAIGAYKVEVNGREITFLDTPGHEAFTAMRARGAQVTDIAILVVAANDGVMPQTIEAINHAKAANIPIIVAVNKIDVEGADVEKVKRELTEYGLVPEEWGGDTIFVPISAKKKINIDTLLEMVLLVADMQDLKVNPNKQAKGTVIEARLDKSKGPIATMLVQRGCLDVGDTIVVGSVIGRIRNMKNDKGQNVRKAGPSTPVEISGLTEVPEAGETFYEVKDEKAAKHLIERRKRQAREKAMNATSAVSLDDLFSQIEKGNLKQLNLIVKADVQGSVEAVKQAVEKLSNDEVKVKVIHANVGAVNETDVTLAKVSNAIIIAFNVRPDALAKSAAEKDNVEIKMYSVIYNAIEDIEAAMKGMLDPVFKEVVIGTAEVRQTFKVSNVGTIAGCYVTDGKIARNSGVRVIRDNIVVFEGKLVSLKRFKDDAKEVAKGYECGIQIEDYNDIKEGDIIEAHIMEEVSK